jgi:hypothetical protein
MMRISSFKKKRLNGKKGRRAAPNNARSSML